MESFVEGTIDLVICEMVGLIGDHIGFTGIFFVYILIGAVLIFDMVFFYVVLIVLILFSAGDEPDRNE